MPLPLRWAVAALGNLGLDFSRAFWVQRAGVFFIVGGTLVLRFTTFKPVTQLEKVNSRKRNDNPWAPFRPISPPLRGDVDLLDATPPPLLESTR